MPVLDVADFADAPCFIVAFYKALGWNPETQELNPRLIRIHPEMWKHFCEQLIDLGGREAGLSWMNFGPSADETNEIGLDKNQVKILKGAITDASKHVQAS